MQQSIVLIIILVAAFCIGRRFWRFLRNGRKNPCGGSCCGCSGAAGCDISREQQDDASDPSRPPGKQS
ncbi:MAG TPA: FeoB-associated Cys-rich membrane protein [Desulfobulbus sp.]|nr:FeoB-associated Cys-rich membrane protein [Desulfobulbus sp.]